MATRLPDNDDDFRRSVLGALSAVQREWWIVAISGLVFAIAGLGASLSESPKYVAAASLYVTSGADADSSSAYQGSLASQQRVESYARLVNSDAVVSDAVRRSGDLGLTVGEAKGALSASSAPGTVMLKISAETLSPSQSASLANSAALAMQDYVATLEKPAAGGDPLAKLTVVSPAVENYSPVSPRTATNVVVAGLVGLLVGLGIIFVRVKLDTRVRDEASLREAVDLPIFGRVPGASDLDSQAPVQFAAGFSPVAEAFRALRSSLTFADVDNPVRKVLVTSASPGDGKSTTVINLGAALAEAGANVVIVDADLRRPSLAPRLGLNTTVGLSTYLAHDADVDGVIQTTKVENLHLLAAGELPPNPSELLASHKMVTLLDSLENLYDYVIVDSPPILAVTDAAVIGQAADSALLVVRAGVTRKHAASQAVELLRASHLRVAGVVLNEVTTRGTYGAYGTYGGYYGSEQSSRSEAPAS